MVGWLRRKAQGGFPVEFERAVTEGHYASALATLLGAAGDVATDDRAASRLATGLGIVATRVGREDLSMAASNVAAAPKDATAVHRLTELLKEQGLGHVRVAFAKRLFRLVPGAIGATLSLATAYEDVARYEEAFQLYETHLPYNTDFFPRYLHAFNAFMSGRLDRSRQLLPKQTEIEDDFLVDPVERLAEMQQRAELVAGVSNLDDRDLRGWHFAITGSILLTTSPDAPEDMAGRYAWLQDSTVRCRTGMERLRVVLQAWELAPSAVLYPPDRESQALATAAAALWDLPVYANDGDLDGLVVVYSLDALNADSYTALSTFAPNRPLFVHASRWTAPEQYTADATTLLVQSISHPWTEKMRVVEDLAGPPPRRVETIPADHSPADVLADQIVAVDADLPHDLTDAELADFADAVRSVATVYRNDGHRNRLWEGGPVRSNRFL